MDNEKDVDTKLKNQSNTAEKDNGEKIPFYKNYKIWLIVVMSIAVIIRLYYFFLTYNQPLWWDEAEYLLQAKHIAFGLPNTGWFAYREPLMPIMLSFVYMIGGNEYFIRILFLAMSIAVIYLMYKLGALLYDKKVGLMAAFLMSVFYLNLFYTYRILLGVPATFFSLLAFYLFWESYFNNKSTWKCILAGILFGIGILTYYSVAFIITALMLYVFLIKKFRMFTEKKIWYFLLMVFLIISPYVIYSLIVYKSPFPRIAAFSVGQPASSQFNLSTWANYILFYPTIMGLPLLIVAIVSMLVLMFNIFIGFDLFIKQKNTDLNKDVATFLLFLVPLVIMSIAAVFKNGYVEDRYVDITFPAIFIIVSSTIFMINKFIAKYQKVLGAVIVIVLLVLISVPLIQYSNYIITIQTKSYLQVEQAGLWIKQNSQPSDVIISESIPQNTYYSERATYFDTVDMKSLIAKYKPKYVIWSAFENSGKNPNSNLTQYFMNNQSGYTIVNAYFADKAQTQPLLIIARP